MGVHVCTHRRRLKPILDTGTVNAACSDITVEGRPSLTVPSAAQLWCMLGKGGQPSWVKAENLTSAHWLASPCDPPPMEEGTLDGAVRTYLAASMLADGAASGRPLPMPRALSVPGVARTMLANAERMNLVVERHGLLVAGPEIAALLEGMLAGREDVIAGSREERMAACRAWMDGIAPHTPSRPAALLMARLLRCTLRQNPSVRRLATPSGWIHTLDAPTRGMRIEAAMAWFKVVAVESANPMPHEWASVADDDSRIVDGVYLRDSALRHLTQNGI